MGLQTGTSPWKSRVRGSWFSLRSSWRGAAGGHSWLYFCEVNKEDNLEIDEAKSSPPCIILAIESSCDETAAAICKDGKILSNHIASQKVHEQYGGVVPELASRAHLQNIVPVVDAALHTANCELQTVDAIAFTQSPGLIGSLLVGAQ